MAADRVLVSDKLSDAGLDVLRSAPGLEVDCKSGLDEAQLCEAVRGAAALIVRSGSQVTAKVIEAADDLRVIGRAGIGVDNIDVAAASKRGILVMNAPTGNATTTAEHAVALLMSLARNIPQATASTKAGKWEKSKLKGRELADKTLGIIGLGNIGRIVADRARGLKMRVIAADPVLSAERAASLGVELVDQNELLSRADFITIHAPLNKHTRGLVGDDAFAKMKEGVMLVNAARGGIVDEAALGRAIESGKVAGAALDVFEQEPVPADSPLLKLDRVICTPHLGAATAEAQDKVAFEISQQVVAFLTEGRVENPINLAVLPREIADEMAPWLDVARRVGLLLGQLDAIDPNELRVTGTGRVGEGGVGPLARQALAGFLSARATTPVNDISAPFVAEDRGIRVIEISGPPAERHANSVRVEVVGAKGEHRGVGILGSGSEPRLVGLLGYEVDAVLSGTHLIVCNEDRPGVIGAVGTILGNRSINVSRMQVGLDEEKREAIALWDVDTHVPDDALEELRQVEHVRSVLCVEL